MQFKSNKVLIVAFNDNFASSRLYNQSILISNIECKMVNAIASDNREVFLTAVFRVHWYPTNISSSTLASYIKDSIKTATILDQTNEKYKDEDINFIENGIIRFKVKYKLEHHESVLRLIGISECSGNKILIQLSGHSPKCLSCEEFGHISSNCTIKREFCKKCNSHGQSRATIQMF